MTSSRWLHRATSHRYILADQAKIAGQDRGGDARETLGFEAAAYLSRGKVARTKQRDFGAVKAERLDMREERQLRRAKVRRPEICRHAEFHDS